MAVAGFGEERGIHFGEKLGSLHPGVAYLPVSSLCSTRAQCGGKRVHRQEAARRSSQNGPARPLTSYRPRPSSVGWTPKESWGIKCSVHDPMPPALHTRERMRIGVPQVWRREAVTFLRRPGI